MNDKIKTLQETQRRLRTLSIFFIICAAACIVLVIIKIRVALVALLALLAFYFLFVQRKTREFQQALKGANLEEGLRFAIKDGSFHPKNGIRRDLIDQADFLPVELSVNVLIRDTLIGTCRGMEAFLTDVTTNYQSSLVTNNGKTRKVAEFLSGCCFDVKLRHYSGPTFLLWPRDCLSDQAREKYFSGKKLWPLSKEEHGGFLAEYFYLYTKDGEDAPVIPEELVKAIRSLAEFTPGKAAVQVTPDHLRIFLRGRFLYMLDIPVRTEITAKLLSFNPFPEMPYLLKILDVLTA